jgi:hypothetical protein
MTESNTTRRLTRTAPAACAFATLALAAALPGCTQLPNTTGLPRGSQLVTETPDFKSGFTAPDDGTIYIFHRGKESFLRYSGPIKSGAVFTIDPEANAATIDGKPLEVTIPSGAHYQVYFRPASADTLDGM